MSLAKYNDTHRRLIASPFVFVAKRMLQENVARKRCSRTLPENVADAERKY
jgi:hypothetical protein